MPGEAGKFQIGVAIRLFERVPSIEFHVYETSGVFIVAVGVNDELIPKGIVVENVMSLIMGGMINLSTTVIEIGGDVTVSPFSETLHFN